VDPISTSKIKEIKNENIQLFKNLFNKYNQDKLINCKKKSVFSLENRSHSATLKELMICLVGQLEGSYGATVSTEGIIVCIWKCVYMYIYVYVHTCIYIYICKYIFIHMHMYVCIIYIYIYMYIFKYIQIYLYRYTCMYIHVYMYIYIYVYKVMPRKTRITSSPVHHRSPPQIKCP
jgi:hypothetical protein